VDRGFKFNQEEPRKRPSLSDTLSNIAAVVLIGCLCCVAVMLTLKLAVLMF